MERDHAKVVRASGAFESGKPQYSRNHTQTWLPTLPGPPVPPDSSYSIKAASLPQEGSMQHRRRTLGTGTLMRIRALQLFQSVVSTVSHDWGLFL